MKKCLGCGILLQSQNNQKEGYVVDIKQDLCQRCFQVTHYHKINKINPALMESGNIVLDKISKLEGCLCYVMDIFMFENSKIYPLHRYLNQREITLILTKSDLMPKTLKVHKIRKLVLEWIKESHLNINQVFILGNFSKEGLDQLLEYLKPFNQVVFFGCPNVGKSTLLKAIVPNSKVTISTIPNTTLDFIYYQLNNQTIIDTPGIALKSSLLNHLDVELIDKILVKKRVKPKVFQIKGKQVIVIDGFCSLIIQCNEMVSVVVYVSNNLYVGRHSLEKYQKGLLLENLLYNSQKEKRVKFSKLLHHDIILDGIGFVAISSKEAIDIEVVCDQYLDLAIRKALI